MIIASNVIHQRNGLGVVSRWGDRCDPFFSFYGKQRLTLPCGPLCRWANGSSKYCSPLITVLLRLLRFMCFRDRLLTVFVSHENCAASIHRIDFIVAAELS